MPNWTIIDSTEKIDQMLQVSKEKTCVVFKHSTRCSISSAAKMRLEDDWDFGSDIAPYYIDVIDSRPISLAFAEKMDVYHESPQVIVVKNEEATFDNSHLDISVSELHEVID